MLPVDPDRVRAVYSPLPAVMNSVRWSAPPKQTFEVHPSPEP
jgi:hypothetical protein